MREEDIRQISYRLTTIKWYICRNLCRSPMNRLRSLPKDEARLAPVIPKRNNDTRAHSSAKADLNRLEDGPWDGIIGYGKLIEQRDWTEWEAPQSGWESTIVPLSPFLPRARARPGLAARTCPSKLHFLFSCCAPLAERIAPLSPPPLFPTIDFSGEKSVENSIMLSEWASERAYISITSALCKDTFHGRINAENVDLSLLCWKFNGTRKIRLLLRLVYKISRISRGFEFIRAPS